MAWRVWPVVCKLIQKQTYSCLSTSYGIWFAFTGLCIVIVAAFHFGEVILQSSMIHYAGKFKFGRYYDNIVGRSFEHRLCLPQPIDIVYTWVNGSDPNLIKQLNDIKQQLRKELNVTSGKLYASRKVREKLINSNKFKWKNPITCPVPNCIPTNKLAISGLPRTISLSQLVVINSNFSSAKHFEFWDEDLDVAFISFESRDKVHNLMHTSLKYKKQELNTSEVFYTSTIKNGYRRVKVALMLYDVEKDTTVENIKNAINLKFPKSVASIELHHSEKLGIIHFTDERFSISLKALSKWNFTINNAAVRLFPVTYIWKPVTVAMGTEDEDLSSNRFADNNELKYSLRSIETYAPWVRKIFIVTNGQIPSWLDLDHPRISLVTHEELFLNKSYLPTFSSPAIETNIHRIPGLSKKFIYMNDDVFFASEVWPDDFFTHSKGHKVFLSWAVPNCNEGCPASWVSDKYCDKACNVSACDWDGGDCLGGKGKSNWQLQAMQSFGQYRNPSGEYCSSGCAHNWIGDRYCDGNCNTLLCGFDGGDCGVKNFKQLFSHKLTKNIFRSKQTVIRAPVGTLSMFINLTNIFNSVIEGNHNDAPFLRTAVLSKKFKVLSLTFYKNFSESSIPFQILGYKAENKTDKAVVFFNVTVATMLPSSDVIIQEQVKQDTGLSKSTKILYPKRLYNETTFHIDRRPTEKILHFPENLSNLSLPYDLSQRLNKLTKEYLDGDITDFGYNKTKGLIYKDYLIALQNNPQGSNAGRKLLWNPANFDDDSTSYMKLMKGYSSLLNNNSPPQKYLKDPFTTFFSFLPWEKTRFMDQIQKMHQQLNVKASYKTERIQRRHLLDAFSSSLLHVSRIYNKAFGYSPKKVPAHMPHMVDRDVINEMQERFWLYFDATSAHKIRHPEDMQFAFSFNYYLISVKQKWNLSTVFDEVDTDKSGTLSDRELRSLTAIIHPLPLNLKVIQEVENKLKNCSKRMKREQLTLKRKREVYFDATLPLVTRNLFMNCHELWRSVNVTRKEKAKFKHEIVGEDDVTFKMIRNNISFVLHQLDWIRKNRRKFVCLNDDLDHAREDTKTIRTILKDFYSSLFPTPSQFELPAKYRNRFLYKKDLELWLQNNKKGTKRINEIVVTLLIILVLFLYRRKILFVVKKCARFLWKYDRNNLDGDNIVSI